MSDKTNEVLALLLDISDQGVQIRSPKVSNNHEEIEHVASLSLTSSSSSLEQDIPIQETKNYSPQQSFNFQSMKQVLFDRSLQQTSKYRNRLTSSAINRQKQQQKIEQENLKILERLRQIRPTQGLKRSELLTNYYRQMQYNTTSSTKSNLHSKRTRSLSHLR